MKKFILGIFVLGIVGLLGLLVVTVLGERVMTNLPQPTDSSQLPQTIVAEDVIWHRPKDNSYNLVIIKNYHLEFQFTQDNSPSLREQSQTADWLMAVNGGYFSGSNIDAMPIGILQQRGDIINPLVRDSQFQVTQVIVFNHDDLTAEIVPADDLPISYVGNESYSLMQTGPIVVNQDQITGSEISASVNGEGRYLRSLLGVTSQNEIVIVNSKVAFSLPEIAERVLSNELLKNRTLDLVNLDGGSSTAFYARELSQFNFGENKRLPLVVGVSSN